MFPDSTNPITALASRPPRALGWQPRRLEPSPVHEDDEAAQYDWMIRRYAWLLNKPFVKMLDKLGLEQGRVLDIGCGPGWIPIELAKRHPGWEIWAVDASHEMVRLARQHAERAGVAERIHFQHGDAAALSFGAGSFDLVVSHFMLHHLDRPGAMLDEAARVARPGGRVVIKDIRRQPGWKQSLLAAFAKHVLRYPPRLLEMYRESMAAGLTIPEACELVRKSKLAAAQVRGFRGLDYVIWFCHGVAATAAVGAWADHSGEMKGASPMLYHPIRDDRSELAGQSGDLAGLEDLRGEWTEEELRLWAAFHRDREAARVPPPHRPEIVN